MRYWRYHSKHVLTNAFDLVGVVGRARGSPIGRNVDRTKGRPDESIVAGCFTLYSKDREKPPFADRAPRPVGNATQARGIGSCSAVAAPARSAGRYGP